MAVGLGSLDMPVPSIAKWEWLNWKFPRPVHAGDTIYARWTLTQKRPPVGHVSTAIVVWRVDVHTADGELCAEGEVGASVTRHSLAAATPAAQEQVQPASPASRRRRRRRTTPAGAGAKLGFDGAAPAPVAEPVAEATAKPATPERSSGGARRRRRRRPAGSTPARNGETAVPAAPVEAPPPPPPAAPVASSAGAGDAANPLRRVIRRLRRP
jgi:hypothetical protein